ncbi:YgaP-like transmembrane domain [Haloquadratum walsbyi]|uniref:Inner membrane protein YgaP-like transmembrane domain-containing protein n=1 Tax=Haloquadratum walsbyi J07HQW2 TaxID=1238425 RepID=U1NJD1_9EURY|nr:YgaP-like transmembrane domain [Haloquadratum walsbyi]ERG97043.1 MAG: protein of unknown function (DUF2892) [Haloquadratum walsbyi J07HQW2]
MPVENVGGRDRLMRGVFTVLLTLVAINTLQKGKYKSGILAIAGAFGLGFNTVTCFCGLNEMLGIDTTDE